MNVTAHFTGLSTFVATVVQKNQPTGTRYESVKIIGRNGIVIFSCGQVECFSQVVGNKTVGSAFFRKNAFIERADNQIFEIETTRFEHSHYLKSVERFTFEWNGNTADKLAYKFQKRINGYFSRVSHRCYHFVQAVE